MWLYEKRLQYPVNVRKPDAKTAKIVISQLGGPNGELGAALRYLNQRYTMPYPRIQALLTLEQKNLLMLKLLVPFSINLPMV